MAIVTANNVDAYFLCLLFMGKLVIQIFLELNIQNQ